MTCLNLNGVPCKKVFFSNGLNELLDIGGFTTTPV